MLHAGSSGRFVDHSEVGEHGEHSTMSVVAFWDVELREDGADVGFNRAFADAEAVRDADVGESVGYELEHSSLPLGQLGY
jgi:hypothetical protein